MRLLAVGIAIRLAIAPITSWSHDVHPLYRATLDMMGGLDPYASSFYTYPPLWAYLLFPFVTLWGLAVDPAGFAVAVPAAAATAGLTEMITPVVTAPHYNLLIKMPVLAADVGVALLLHRWGSDTWGPSQGRKAFLIWFLNPLVIWVNAAHGQFDALPVFLTVAAGFLLLRNRYLLAGTSLGLAVLFKVYPLFLLLPWLFLAVGLARGPGSNPEASRREVATRALLFATGVSATLVLFGLPLLGTRFENAVLARRAQFPVVGGFNAFFFLALGVWEDILVAEVFTLPSLGVSMAYLLVIPLVLSLWEGIRIHQRVAGRRPVDGHLESLLAITVVTLVALYAVLTPVNPQHLLWILPFLALGSVRWPRLRTPTLLVSLSGFAFLLALQTPSAFFYPLAAFSTVLPPETIHAHVAWYWGLPGLLSDRLQQDLLFLASAAGFLALLTAALRIRSEEKSRLDRQGGGSPPGRGHPPTAFGGSATPKIAALALAFLVLSQVAVLQPRVPGPARVEEVRYDPESGELALTLIGHSLYPAAYRVTVIGLAEQPAPLPIVLYHDERFPISNTSVPRIFGILDHLESELTRAHVPAEIGIVDAPGLFDVLRGPPVVLILATTVLPSSLLLDAPGLMQRWVDRGGILVWVGSFIGAYAGMPAGTIIYLPMENPVGGWGPSRLLGVNMTTGEVDAAADVSTPWQRALDIRFPLATWGARLREVNDLDGLVLGGRTGGARPSTSLALLPVGNGTVALFGDATGAVFSYSAEDVVAHDIARMLLSGLLFNPSRSEAHLLETQAVALDADAGISLRLPLGEVDAVSVLQVLLFSEVGHDPLLYAVTLSADPA